MSLFELLVVLIVGVLVTKPEDFPKIIKAFKRGYSFVSNTKEDIMSYFNHITKLEKSFLEDSSANFRDEIDQVNFYLEKISSLGVDYEGDYSLRSIKNCYRKLMQDKVKENHNISTQNKN